jgi:hypothetical protein
MTDMVRTEITSLIMTEIGFKIAILERQSGFGQLNLEKKY